MSKKETIKAAIETARVHGYELPAEVARNVADIENPTYRVAVVGKYQVGKSTLVNHTFLGDNPLLSEGHGLCNTAVATDIEFGDTAKLEVYEWAENGGETCVMSKNGPSAEDVLASTVSSASDTRSDLAQRVSRVRLVSPNESLQGYSIVDTPGLDDPNKELLLNTTYRIIPGSDVALLVVAPRMLDEIETELLRNDLIGHGVTKLMVLVSYNPEDMHLSREKREEVRSTIKAQLDKIGRGDIPVEMYCFDPSIDDIINDASELRLTIRSFLNENALPGREERIAFSVKQALENFELELAAKLKTIGSSEAEKAALKEKIEKEVADFKSKCEKAFQNIQEEMRDIMDTATGDVDNSVHGAFSAFYEKLELSDTVDGMKKILNNAENTLKSDLSQRINQIGTTIKTRMETVLARYANEVNDIQSKWNLFLDEDFDVKRPFVAKIPTIVFDAINVVALNIILPFGWITAIVAHLFGKQFFNPTTWAVKHLILKQVKTGLDDSEDEVRQQVMNQIRGNIANAFSEIKTGIESVNQAQVQTMLKAIDDNTDSDERASLESAKADIAAAILSLQ